MKTKTIQIIAGIATSFLITLALFYLLEREGGIFSGTITAFFTGLGIVFGRKTKR